MLSNLNSEQNPQTKRKSHTFERIGVTNRNQESESPFGLGIGIINGIMNSNKKLLTCALGCKFCVFIRVL